MAMYKRARTSFAKISWLASIFFLAPCSVANSYLTEGDLHEEIPVVYGINHFIQPVQEAPAAVSVIDRELIAAIDAQSIGEILALAPGVSLQINAQGGLARGYQFSGEPFARRMHVEIDGRPLSESMLVTALWDDLGIDIDNIERVEVIRGSNLAADGGNALLGTINIITRTALLAPRVRLSVRGNEDGYRRYSLNAAKNIGSVDAQFWMQQRRKLPLISGDSSTLDRDDGFSLVGDADDTGIASDSQSYEYDRSVGGKLLWSPTALDSVQFSAGFSESRRYHGLQQARYNWQQLDWQRQIKDGGEWRGFVFHNLNKVKAEGEIAVGEVNSLIRDPLVDVSTFSKKPSPSADNELRQGDLFQVDESAWSERWDAELRRLWRSDMGWQWSLGAAASLDRTRSKHLTSVSKTLERSSVRLYSTAEWRLNSNWLLSGGSMFEWTEHLSSIGAARVGVNYNVSPQQTLRIASALGARQPTLLEQRRESYFEDADSGYVNIISLSSGQIDIEKIELLELGYHWHSKNRLVDLDLRWYKQWSKDTIVAARLEGELITLSDGDFLEISEEFTYYANRADLTQQGAELQISARSGTQWLMHLTLSYLDTDDYLSPLSVDSPFSLTVTESSESLAAMQGAAQWSLSATASYTLNPNWQISSHYTWQDSLPRWFDSPGKSFGQWDIISRYKWTIGSARQNWQISVAARNIGNHRPADIVQLLGRRVVLTLEYKWP